MKVTIVNYGIGNILSVQRAFMHCGAEVVFATTEDDIKNAERLVVPGVGAFKRCMKAVEEHGLKQALIDYANSGKPYLGICVGMQMLMEKSFEFGEYDGLGLIKGSVQKMEVEDQRIPFIGWKEVELNGDKNQFYFVHSYQAKPTEEQDVLATYEFGGQKVVAAVKNKNVMGVQFHPEKSAADGLSFIKEFMAL